MISEPLPDGIPFGNWVKSIDGDGDASAPSSVTAKCWKFVRAAGSELFWPRCASIAVIAWKTPAAPPLKPKLTTTPCVGSVVACGFEISLPVRNGVSLST